MNGEQSRSEVTILRARPSPPWPAFLGLFQIGLAWVLFAAFFQGLSGLLSVLAELAVVGIVFLVLRRLRVLDELSFDDEGVVLRSSRKGFLAPKAEHFRWDEVEAVRPGSFPARRDLTVTLTRERQFWTFRPQPTSGLTIPAGLWRDGQFCEALRRCVASEKVAPGVLGPDPAAGRRARLTGGILLACALAVALGSMVFLFEPTFSFWFWVGPVLACPLLGAWVLWMRFDGPPDAETVVGGALGAVPFLFVGLFVLCLLNVASASVVAAALSAVAGLLLGAAVLAFLGRRAQWSHVGLFYLLGVAGWGAGVMAWDGIPSVRLGEVSWMPSVGWTAHGDGFALQQVGSEEEGLLLQWYSADGTPERSVPLPISLPGHTFRWTLAVGQDAVLYQVRGDKESELFVVPRRVGRYRLIATRTQVWDAKVSPDGHRCVFGTQTEEAAPKVLGYLELPDGEVERSPVPSSVGKVDSVGILNDGRLVLVTGQGPRDLEGRWMGYRSELPDARTWKPTYEPVQVWLWGPRGGEVPRLLHAEEDMSLGWRLATTSSPLYVCRVVGDGTRRKEFVEVKLDSDPPEVRPSLPSRLEWFADPVSADGRFVIETRGKSVAECMYVRDTVTGRSRRLRRQAAGLFRSRVLWSPTGHTFFYTTARVPFSFGWKPGSSVDRLRQEARLVDLDRCPRAPAGAASTLSSGCTPGSGTAPPRWP